MSAPSKTKHSEQSRSAIVLRALLTIVMLAPISVLSFEAWHSASAVVTTTNRETDAIAFLRSLQPILTTLTEDETLAVSGAPVDPSTIDADLQAGTTSDKQYGDELQTHTRWSGFVTAVDKLQTLGKPTPINAFNSYGAVSELLLDVYERIRDQSGLVRDQEPDVFYLEDAAITALPASVVDAGRYGDSITAEFTSSGSDATAAALNVPTYHALLNVDSGDVGDDVSDAVGATASQSMSTSLLSAIDRYRQTVERLSPLVPTAASKSSAVNQVGVPLAQAAEESTAAALSGTLYDDIATLVTARGLAARQQERLDLGSLAAAVLLVVAMVYIDVRRARRRRPSRVNPSAPSWDIGPDPTSESSGGGHRWGPVDAPAELSTRERAGAPQ
jgi:hypothetical protein